MYRLLLLVLFSFSLFSCNSDDTKINFISKKKLTLEANNTNTFVHKPVYFTIKDTDGNILDKTVFITDITNEETILESNIFKPTKAGLYTFKAQGLKYSDSPLTYVNVKNSTAKEFILNGEKQEVTKAELVVHRGEYTDEEGNTKLRDIIMVTKDNRRHNIYTLSIYGKGDPIFPNIKITFLVHNPNIKIKDGKIIDYGPRILPNQTKDIQINELSTYSANSSSKGYPHAKYTTNNLFFYYLDAAIPDVETQVLKNSYIEFNFEDISINYTGDITYYNN